MILRFRKAIPALLLVLPVGLSAACQLDAIIGVANLDDPTVVGLLTLNEEKTRAYVGQRVGGTQWDPVSKLVAVNTTTGNELASTPAWFGPFKMRAAATDPGNDNVWTMHANGAVVEWPEALGTWLSWDGGVLSAPPGETIETFCDMEILPSGHFVATGVATHTKPWKKLDFVVYVRPDPASPNNWTRSFDTWDSWRQDIELLRQCPRVSHDVSSGQVTVLKPSLHSYSGPFDNHVVVYDVGALEQGGNMQFSGGFTLDVSPEYLPLDITSEYGRTIISASAWDPTSLPDRMELYVTATGQFEDSLNFETLSAIDMVHPASANDPYGLFSQLWWSGVSYDDDDFGIVSTIVDPGDT